ncbi:hypothetical protein ACIBAH_30000 [Streptomyces sp. NPDC051445]|uniref:hypothetical protein n=1 Tax=Streptomyces sp. NPDC051445 TaxID=3365653 RepID=UPI0037A48FD4
MTPEAPEEPQAQAVAASPKTVPPREANVSETEEAEDLDALYARYGLVRRWRVLPEPKSVPIDPQSTRGLPLLGEGDLIAYGGDGGVRDSSYFYFGNERDGGRLLAGRLFQANSKLEPWQIVHTWTEGEIDRPWARTATTAKPSSPEARAEAREARLAARAVEARNEAALGNTELIEKFMAADLDLWRGARWQEPVTTALLGDWASTLYTHGTIRRGLSPG